MRAKRIFNTSVLPEKGCYFLFYFYRQFTNLPPIFAKITNLPPMMIIFTNLPPTNLLFTNLPSKDLKQFLPL